MYHVISPNSSWSPPLLPEVRSLEELLGPRRQELVKVVPMTVIYVVVFVTGVVGNFVTCVVIARHRYMHTVTNFYLVNLAVSDLLLLVLGLPLETYSFWSAYPWRLGEAFCILRTLAAETSTYASILTITAFTVERYVAICHPMWIQTKCSLQRAARVIVVIWTLAGVCAVPIGVQYGVVYVEEAGGELRQDSATCNLKPERSIEHSFEVSTFLFFLAPMSVITALYALIALTIRRSTLARTYTDLFGGGVAVVVAFLICWAPFHTQRLMSIYLPGSPSTDPTTTASLQATAGLHHDQTNPHPSSEHWSPVNTFQSALFYVSGVLYYVSAVINPILYNIMSLKFRQSFRATMLRPCACWVGDKRARMPDGHTRRQPASIIQTYRFQSRQPGDVANMTRSSQ